VTTKQQKKLIKLTYKLELLQSKIQPLLVELSKSINYGYEEVFESINAEGFLYPLIDEMYSLKSYIVRTNPSLKEYDEECIKTIKYKLIRDEDQ
jgi:hypothetical protein